MKIRFDSDDDIPLNKQLNFLSVTVVIKDGKLRKMVSIVLRFF